jgi:hypothetical protein
MAAERHSEEARSHHDEAREVDPDLSGDRHGRPHAATGG